MPRRIDTAIFPVPLPSPIIGVVTAIGYAVILLGFDPVLPSVVIDARMAPAAAIGGLLFYGIVLWIIAQRDPRIWHDKSQFAEYVKEWATGAHLTVPNDTELERLRAETWRASSVAMAQQAGATAGAGAGITVSDYSWPMAIIVFFGTMLVVGLFVRRWLMARDRMTLGVILASSTEG